MSTTHTQPRFSSSQLTLSTVPWLCHPKIERIHGLAKERSEALGIVLPEFYDAHASMSAYLYSTAPVDRVVTTTLFNSLLFYIDDVLGEDIVGDQANDALAVTLMAAWQGKPRPSDVQGPFEILLSAVEAVRNDILQKSNPGFFRRLTDSVQGHLRHVFRPRTYRTLEGYLFTRAHFSGMYPTLIMAEFATATYLDESIIESIPSLRCAEGACVHIGGLSNDLFSYPKERHSTFNLVNAYLELGLVSSLDEAVQCAIDLVNHYHHVYDESIERARSTLKYLSRDSRRVAEAYVDGMENILSASYHWQRFTERYRHPEHVFDDLR